MRRATVSTAVVILLLHFASRHDVLSLMARPLVCAAFQAVGVAAVECPDGLLIGSLRVPWTRDCGGLSMLAVLLALTVWLRREERQPLRYLAALMSAAALAIVANLARVALVIAWRAAFQPAVESPSVHYLMGFLCLLPCVWLLLPPGGVRRLESFYYAVVLAALAPHVDGPGGVVASLCTLLVLSASRLRPCSPRLLAVWGAAGLAVAISRMESMWLPWLLLCPAFVPTRVGRGVSGAVLTAGTIPLVAMHALFLAAVLPFGWIWARARRTLLPSPAVARPAAWALTLLLLLPFAAPALAGLTTRAVPPPPGLMCQQLDATSWRVRSVGQPAGLELVWYADRGDGRHHSLPVCMAFRGVTLTRVPGTSVLTDGRHWFREVFIVGGDMLDGYSAYLRRTALPFTPAGVHLVVAADRDGDEVAAFEAAATRAAEDLRPLVQ